MTFRFEATCNKSKHADLAKSCHLFCSKKAANFTNPVFEALCALATSGGNMSQRVDTSSRLIRASALEVYEAFAKPGAMERWLPPRGMIGKMLSFDFRAGGGYRMRLTYEDLNKGQGKTSADSDETVVRLVRLDPGQRIVQDIDFDSDDLSFKGTMRMTWTFETANGGTLVQICAENVPEGIKPKDHQAGLDSSLANLARFTQARRN